MTPENTTISVKDLHKSYGNIKAVDGLSFHVSEGEVYSLLGPNGAGKTTTVEILEGIRKPDRGEVTIMGHDPWKSSSGMRMIVGILPQDFRFIERITPKEAITFYSTLFGVPDRSRELIDLVELDEVKNVQYMNLSGGQKQKLGICLALVNDPKVVFLDEPTTGLDPHARRRIWELIRKLKAEKRTIILTTHYLEEAEILADRVGIVDHGKMLVEGTPTEIIANRGKGRSLHVVNDSRIAAFAKTELGLNSTSTDGELSIQLAHGKDLLRILTFIEENDISLAGLQLKEDTLEDIFIDLIGKGEEE